ncbi:alpha/beta-hydrolase [Whalleya microplaca]|nr:alpha/beta-hydrolase [Whalleya microplaca]
MSSHEPQTAAAEPLPALPLPEGITSDYIDCTASCGLNFHVLTAGSRDNPLVLFCHGYPELAYSWRKVLPHIAAAGYYCVAMDQRGYGRTTGWPRTSYEETDLSAYVPTNLVRDLVCLVHGLGYTTVRAIIGHDFGAVAAAASALIRPDIFRATVQLSHPHRRPPTPNDKPKIDIQAALARLDPPRKHYQWDNASPSAAAEWAAPPQGLEAFLRGYFHLKSADWAGNTAARPLARWDAEALATLPEYYVMRRSSTMAQTVARLMAGEDAARSERWLSPADLAVYAGEWARTGFQGALNWYRGATARDGAARDMLLFVGRRIEVPCAFVSGAQDWGNYQVPGALEGYADPAVVKEGCFWGVRLVEGAGHWVQQEQPEAVVRELLAFLGSLGLEPRISGYLI